MPKNEDNAASIFPNYVSMASPPISGNRFLYGSILPSLVEDEQFATENTP